MKTATLPALRVSPALRESAQLALRPHETLSKLMEASLESFIAQRQAEDDFIARGLRGAQQAKEKNLYIAADEVIAKLEQRLAQAKLGRQVGSSEVLTPKKRPSRKVAVK